MTARPPSSGDGRSPAAHRPPRCFAPDLASAGPIVELSAGEARHAGLVLRCRSGDEVELFDGLGRSARGRFLRLERDRAAVETGPTTAEAPPTWPAVLIQGFPKGEKKDWIVRAATELGFPRVVFVSARYSVGRPRPADAARWRAVAIAAAKQCGRNWLPQIESADDLSAALLAAADLSLLADAAQDAPALRSVARPAREAGARSVCAAVGPEGGWAEEEVRDLMAAGFVPVRLGPHIFRTETAAMAIMAALVYEFAPAGG